MRRHHDLAAPPSAGPGARVRQSWAMGGVERKSAVISPFGRDGRVACVLAGALIFLAAGWPVPVQAQSRDVQKMMDRLDRLEREFGTLQRQAFGGRAPGPTT